MLSKDKHLPPLSARYPEPLPGHQHPRLGDQLVGHHGDGETSPQSQWGSMDGGSLAMLSRARAQEGAEGGVGLLLPDPYPCLYAGPRNGQGRGPDGAPFHPSDVRPLRLGTPGLMGVPSPKHAAGPTQPPGPLTQVKAPRCSILTLGAPCQPHTGLGTSKGVLKGHLLKDAEICSFHGKNCKHLFFNICGGVLFVKR